MVQLPKYLTPMQAVAWVSLRDPAMVELAGDLKTPSPGRVAKVKLPSGAKVEALPGRPGLSLIKISALHATKQIEGELLVLPPEEAERELLAELREGRIIAHGHTAPGGRAERIPSIDWQAMGLSDGGDGTANALFACTLYPDGSATGLRAEWQDVMLEGAELIRRWPPNPPREERAAAWAIREAQLALAVKASEEGMEARPGFTWAGDALRRIAWGEVVYPHPEGMSPDDAFAAVKAASQRLCDALATGEIQATGRRGRMASGRLVAHDSAVIPGAYFRPGIAINLASWAAPDDSGSMPDYALWRDEDAPDWAWVMLRTADVEALMNAPAKAAGRSEVAPASLNMMPSAPIAPESAKRLAGRKAKAKYSDKALGAWFLLRQATWDRSLPFPNRDEDFEAAKDEFDRVPPDNFRRIRREKTDEKWRTRGQRRAAE